MTTPELFDVAIVGAGPAGLSAALVLGRCRRLVVVVDGGRPRNYAATAVNGYLGVEAASPGEFREIGRQQVCRYGVQFVDAEVAAVRRASGPSGSFELSIQGRPPILARKLLLATGVRDVLPDIENIEAFYGKSVHHCPYCDGWEHRDQRLVALGDGDAAVSLALSLRTWSAHVTACSTGRPPCTDDRRRLAKANVSYRPERPVRFEGSEGVLREIVFAEGPPLECDALFFSNDQSQRSLLPRMLGCESDSEGLVRTGKKQGTGVEGLYLAGDADGDVQFAIVAAAEGAIAATAINGALQ